MDNPEQTLKRLIEEMGRVVVGQRALVEGLLIGMLTGGHVLVEGVPGLAKTTAVRTLAAALGLGFGRIQFTPDLLPGDLTGNPIFVPDRQEFAIRKGPIFTPVLLADEINRAPSKVQSALLEAMEEHQVTIGDETLALPEPFLVMATQNPVELEGTYPLPEAQIDRFLLKLVVPYPSEEEERIIVERSTSPPEAVRAIVDREGVMGLRAAVDQVHVAPEITDYAVRLVRATREPEQLAAQLDHYLQASRSRPVGEGVVERVALLRSSPVTLGASPRASIFLVRAARARALLDARQYTTPDDVKRVAPDVLRHRMIVSYEAEADGIKPEIVIDAILASVEAP